MIAHELVGDLLCCLIIGNAAEYQAAEGNQLD